MNRFFRWYYQNKNKFWVIVLVIIGSYGLILLLNNLSRNNNSNKTSIKYNYTNENTITSQQSVISGEYLEEKVLVEANEIIDKFISYCNNKEISKAYSLISEDCKNELFPTIEDFTTNYYNRIFNTTKIYEMQNWSGRTYRIKFMENPMETGNINNGEFIEDYFTIVKKNGKILLEINNY